MLFKDKHVCLPHNLHNYYIMKKITVLISALLLISFFSCNTESINDEKITQDPNFRVFEAKVKKKGSVNGLRTSLDEPCMTTNLIAGQNYIAGTVTVDIDGEN